MLAGNAKIPPPTIVLTEIAVKLSVPIARSGATERGLAIATESSSYWIARVKLRFPFPARTSWSILGLPVQQERPLKGETRMDNLYTVVSLIVTLAIVVIVIAGMWKVFTKA